MKILYPKLVCFGYHFLENLPFSLHYCYVKITIFLPMVSKIELRFYLKPVNREYPYSSVGMRAACDHRDVGMRAACDHRDVPDALPSLPCPQDPGQPDYLLLYHSCVFSNFTQTRKVWNKLLNIRGILGYANQKKICIFSLYDYYVKWKERLAASAVSAKETIVFHLLKANLMEQPPWSSAALVFLGSNKGRLDDSSFPCCPGGAVNPRAGEPLSC